MAEVRGNLAGLLRLEGCVFGSVGAGRESSTEFVFPLLRVKVARLSTRRPPSRRAQTRSYLTVRIAGKADFEGAGTPRRYLSRSSGGVNSLGSSLPRIECRPPPECRYRVLPDLGCPARCHRVAEWRSSLCRLVLQRMRNLRK